jgi:myo-inositol-1(or 4)-monophosphatase
MDLLEAAEKMAIDAGNVLMGYFGKKLESKRKKDSTPVSAADLASNDFILKSIKSKFPDHFILSEESNADGGLKDGYNWIIDPLDGTSNFLHGLPYFCVSIACVKATKKGQGFKTEGLAGVVYNPATNELYKAANGKGAFLGDKRLSASKTDSLSDSFLACGYHGGDVSSNYGKAYIKISITAEGSRRLGSAALDIAKTAEGVFDVFFDPVLRPWDIAAGSIIMAEANGDFKNFPGQGDSERFDLMERGIIAGNSKLVREVSAFFEGEK